MSNNIKKGLLVFAVALAFGSVSCQEHALSGTVPEITPIVKTTLPHDPQAFTQGLFFDNGRLYESTGLYGKSSMRILDAATGAIIKNQPVASVFGEGCARMGNSIFQITWQEQQAIIYSFPDLAEKRTAIYAGEGWGLTTDGRNFIMSTGSDTLYVRDTDFAIVRKIPVRMNNEPVFRLNELEYVNGLIYANVWFTDYILEINPKNGRVMRKIDCKTLIRKEQPESQENVLNGIAYDPSAGSFYITGKNWKNIFVVTIPR